MTPIRQCENDASQREPTPNNTWNVTWGPFNEYNLSYLIVDWYPHLGLRYRQSKYGFWSDYFPTISLRDQYTPTAMPTPSGYEYVIATGSMSAVVIVLFIILIILIYILVVHPRRFGRRDSFYDDMPKRIYRKNSSDASDSVDDDRERTPTSNKYTACNSENCVRCNRYHNLRSQAPEKLSAFVEKSSLSGLIRLRDSLRNDVDGAATDEVSEDEEVQRQRPNVLYVAGPESTPWWNADRFPAQTELLEKNHENIVEEFENVAPSSSGWVRNTTESGCWRAFFLINQGCRIAENCRRCPKTAELVEHCLENVMKDCVFGNVFFSVVEAGTSISAHCGPTNVRLRCHLGLCVPPDCWLTVAGETRRWTRAKCSWFDDSFTHSVSCGDGTEEAPRVVLLLDFWHPGITDIEKQAIRAVF
ncbi:Aspartate beta-hydroxylase domain-containing protein 2 [Lamellibrachia satsuma]|nr:Aspartate beta-hydroxylase domain-containing protein 2 [Lamellibrachia satsuma]